MRALFADPSYAGFRRYRPLYDVGAARRGRARDAVRGGSRARVVVPPDGRVPLRRVAAAREGPPLVAFVTRTKAGYCQHFAGAMAAMLRMLGIPARVAVGFTSGEARGRNVGRDRPRGARLGRGVVRRASAGSRSIRRRAAARSEASTRSHPTRGRRRRAARGELGESTTPARRRACPDAGDLPGDDRRVRTRAGAVARRRRTRSRRALDRAPRGGQGGRTARSLPLARPTQARDGEPSRARGLPPRPGRRRSGERDARRRCRRRSTTSSGSTGAPSRPLRRARASGRPRRSTPARRRLARELRRLIRAARRELSVWARFRGLVSLRSLRSASGS